jgi:hypothetical protein
MVTSMSTHDLTLERGNLVPPAKTFCIFLGSLPNGEVFLQPACAWAAGIADSGHWHSLYRIAVPGEACGPCRVEETISHQTQIQVRIHQILFTNPEIRDLFNQVIRDPGCLGFARQRMPSFGGKCSVWSTCTFDE